jgi:O-antigen/teichoic acid export membrane protein
LSSTPEVRRGRGLIPSASLTLATRLVAFGFSAITNVILARSLGPEGRGIYAVAVMFSAIIALLAQLGIGPANVYHLSKKLIDLDELIGHSTSLALLLGTSCFLIVLALIVLTGSDKVLGVGSKFVLVACGAVPFMLLTAFMQSLLQGGQRFVHFNTVLLIQYAAPTAALILSLFLFKDRTLGAVSAWTASSAVTAASAAYAVAPLSRFSLRMRSATMKSLLRFGMISYLSNLTSYVNYRFDVLIVNLFAGARQVGLYSVGTSLAEIVWFITNAASVVLAPRVAASRLEEADRLTEAVARVVLLMTVGSAGLLALFAPVIVTVFFGTAFAESEWAVWLLLPGIVTFSVGRLLSMYLLGRNKLKVDLLAASVGLVLTLALDFALIPVYGFRGAAVASSIAYTAAMLVNLVWVVRHSSITLGGLLVARPNDMRVVWRRIRETVAPAEVSTPENGG